MDYTTAPRSLIYRERRSLEEFGIYEDDFILRRLSDAIFDFDFIRAPNAEERARWCMNNAFYICTMFFLERDPKWRYDQYIKIATPERNGFPLDLHFVTLSLVGLLLSRLEDPFPFISDKGKVRNSFIMSMLKNGENKYIFNHLSKSLESDFLKKIRIPNKTFAPRVINAEAVHDVLMDGGFNWVKFTNYWEERTLREIVKAFGETEEEKHYVIDILRQTSQGFYAKGFRCEYVNDLLDSFDEAIRSQYKSESPHTTHEPEASEKDVKLDVTTYEMYIKEVEELKAKVYSLQKDLEEAHTIPNTVTAQQKVRMELARKLMEAAGINEEILAKWGNKDKTGTLMGTMLDILPSTCKTYLSDPCMNYEHHKETVDKINPLLDALGFEFTLQKPVPFVKPIVQKSDK